MDQTTTVSGRVTEVFAHRFVLATETGTILADLGPKGAEKVQLKIGDSVEVSGETKPSELKVSRIAKEGAAPVDIEHAGKPKPGDKPDHKPGDKPDHKPGHKPEPHGKDA